MIENLKIKMLIKAVLRHPRKKLSPCGDMKSFADCFTQFKNIFVFWYKVGNDTHVITEII